MCMRSRGAKRGHLAAEVLAGNKPAIASYLSGGLKVLRRVDGKLTGNETFAAGHMNNPSLTTTMFDTQHFAIRNLLPTDLPNLQTLFEENPDYFRAVNARLPFADEAEVEFNELPPAHLSHGERWFAGVFDRSGTLQGVLHVVSDLIAPGVWHIALFFLATPLHGTGAAREIYAELESWMQRSGATWIRLGVVAGNARAEQFWDRMGYRPTRVRAGVDTGGKINDVRMLLKPLSGGAVEQYFALVPRDHPESLLS